MLEKEKIHANSYQKLNNLQENYDDSLYGLKDEFKKKEAVLKEKYDQLELTLKQAFDDKIQEKNEIFELKEKKLESIHKQNINVSNMIDLLYSIKSYINH